MLLFGLLPGCTEGPGTRTSPLPLAACLSAMCSRFPFYPSALRAHCVASTACLCLCDARKLIQAFASCKLCGNLAV